MLVLCRYFLEMPVLCRHFSSFWWCDVVPVYTFGEIFASLVPMYFSNLYLYVDSIINHCLSYIMMPELDKHCRYLRLISACLHVCVSSCEPVGACVCGMWVCINCPCMHIALCSSVGALWVGVSTMSHHQTWRHTGVTCQTFSRRCVCII